MILWRIFRDDLNFQTPNSFNSLRAYGQSKLANVLHAKKLARDLSATGIKVFSLHPGVICKSLCKKRVVHKWRHSLIRKGVSMILCQQYWKVKTFDNGGGCQKLLKIALRHLWMAPK